MPKRKLDEKGKSRKNLLQQIRHTEDRIHDVEIALEEEEMSPQRREELEEKIDNRKMSVEQKKMNCNKIALVL